jgi:hypothetical protein
MKNLMTILTFTLIGFAFAGKKTNQSFGPITNFSVDTMPDICRVITSQEIESLHVFDLRITNSYPEPDPVENFHACYYEFFEDAHRPARIGISLQKFSTKQDAADVITQFINDNLTTGMLPETVKLGHAARMTLHEGCNHTCMDATLVVSSGIYVIYIGFKAPDGTLRATLKQKGIKIVNMLFDRVPGLTPR